jgi:hypothetical protein
MQGDEMIMNLKAGVIAGLVLCGTAVLAGGNPTFLNGHLKTLKIDFFALD